MAHHKLIFKLADLPPAGIDFSLLLSKEDFGGLLAENLEAAPELLSDLSGQLKIAKSGQRLLLGGGFKVLVKCQCDRCLKEFSLALDAEIDDVFRLTDCLRVTDEHDDNSEEELLVRDGRVDLSPYLVEFFWLAWPLQCLCDDSCQGLCVRCGADLNKGPCSC